MHHGIVSAMKNGATRFLFAATFVVIFCVTLSLVRFSGPGDVAKQLFVEVRINNATRFLQRQTIFVSLGMMPRCGTFVSCRVACVVCSRECFQRLGARCVPFWINTALVVLSAVAVITWSFAFLLRLLVPAAFLASMRGGAPYFFG